MASSLGSPPRRRAPDVVLGAWYMLWMVERVFFGPLREPVNAAPDKSAAVRDLSAREVAALVPLLVFVVWIGVQPKFFLDRMKPAVNKIGTAAAASWDTRMAEYKMRPDGQKELLAEN